MIVLQDYLGAIIVFIAILTALITSYLLPNDSSPSLVGLALGYTLLIPIYLNWVVQLSANMEMYFGACERISYCIENGNQEVEGEGCEHNACKYSKHTQYDLHPNNLCSFKDESLPEKWPQFGNIEFRLVSLKHANQSDSFIRDLSINIPAGQRVSINIFHINLLSMHTPQCNPLIVVCCISEINLSHHRQLATFSCLFNQG